MQKTIETKHLYEEAYALSICAYECDKNVKLMNT